MHRHHLLFVTLEYRVGYARASLLPLSHTHNLVIPLVQGRGFMGGIQQEAP